MATHYSNSKGKHFKERNNNVPYSKKTTHRYKTKNASNTENTANINNSYVNINEEAYTPEKVIKKDKSSGGQTFMRGAMILSASIIIVKILGMIFRILFSNLCGAVGNGIFNTAYELYNVIFMVATAGFPIALSRLVSENVAKGRYRDIKQIHKISIPFFTVTGLLFCVIMISGSGWYANLVHSPNVQLPVIFLAPIVLFGCLMSIYRGYFEGMRNMTPTAISEIIEISGKVIVGLSLAYLVTSMGNSEYEAYGTLFGQVLPQESFEGVLVSYAVCAAFIGISLGSFAGFVFLLLRYRIKGNNISQSQLASSPVPLSNKKLLKRLALTAIPIGLGSIVMSIASSIDTVFIQTRILDIMHNTPQALQNLYPDIPAKHFIEGADTIQIYLFGCYGYSLTLMMLVTAITQAFGQSAMPSLTAAWTKGNKEQIKSNIETVLKTTLLVTLPSGIGLSVLAKPLLSLIYTVDPVELDIAAKVLTVMGISVIFIATSTPICSMLQAVGRVDMPLKLLIIGMVIKIILNYTLVGIPSINIQGAAVGSLVGYLFIVIVGIYFLCKETKIVPNFMKIFIKPLIASIFCGIGAYASYGLISLVLQSKITTLISIVIAVIIYVIALLLVKGLTKDDILMLPKGHKIAKTLEKYRIIR